MRREAILDAAAPAFAAAPAAEVIVADIARAAGVSEALVFKYFGTKTGLQAAVLDRAADDLAARRDAEDAARDPHTPARERVKRALSVWLDALAEGRGIAMTSAAGDPVEVARVRSRVRADWWSWLTGVIQPDATARHSFALNGFLGFLDAAGAAWSADGCPVDRRWPLIETALGALEGALGDWRS